MGENFSLNTPGDLQPQTFKFQNWGILLSNYKMKKETEVFIYLAICLGLVRTEYHVFKLYQQPP